MNIPLKMAGIGLRSAHYSAILNQRPKFAWLEVHSENYLSDGGRPLNILETLRQDYPISLHGVSLSLGSADELNWRHLKKLNDLCNKINPCLVSEHLSWSSINGKYLHDLLPLPYTQESLKHVITRINQVQHYLNRQILIENITSYVNFDYSTMTEAEFINEVAKQTGCGILLDVSNLYINAMNKHIDMHGYLSSISKQHVHEIHLGGFSSTSIQNKKILIDSHNHSIHPEVWKIYQQTLAIIGIKPTIIEWDSDLPSLETLFEEAYHAERIIGETYAASRSPV